MTLRPSINCGNSKAKSGTGLDRSSNSGPITTAAAARLLGVTAPTVIRYMELGKLEGITLPGGHRRITMDSVERILKARP